MRSLAAKVDIRMYFRRCKPSFVRRLVWDLATCKVVFTLDGGIPPSETRELLDIVDATAEVRSSVEMFSHLALRSDTLDRIHSIKLSISTGTAPVNLDLQHVSAEKTQIQVSGDAMACVVHDAHKLSFVTCDRLTGTNFSLKDSLVAIDRTRSHMHRFRILTLEPSTLSAFTDIAGKVPTSAVFDVLVCNVSGLRFLEVLKKEGIGAVNLLAGDANAHLCARMVQLILRTSYPVIVYGEYLQAVQRDIGRLASVHAVRERMSESEQEQWFFTKYINV